MTGPAIAFSNPGHLPWMAEAAAALEEIDGLAAYISPASFSSDQLGRLERRLGPLGRRIGGELGRRTPPDRVPGTKVRRSASMFELAAVAAKRARAPRPVSERLAGFRDRAFDRGVARKAGTLSEDALVAGFGAALATIHAAPPRLTTLLDYPLTHHRYTRQLLQEESRLQPAFRDTLQFHEYPRSRDRRIDEELQRVDRVLVMSRYAKQTFAENGVDPAKLDVLPFGIDLDLFSPADRGHDSAARPESAFRVLFVGQITQRKGISYLFDGFEKAREANWELVMVGSVVGSAASWQGKPGVRHIPWCRRQELPDLYRGADVFVLPSLIEGGFTRVTQEAMACGLPVVLTPAGGSGEALTEAGEGVAVPIRDGDAIAEALTRVARSSSERTAMGEAARSRAKEFPWSRYARTLSEIVEASGSASR